MEDIRTCTQFNQSMDVVNFQKYKTPRLDMGHGVCYTKQIIIMTYRKGEEKTQHSVKSRKHTLNKDKKQISQLDATAR